MDADVVVLGAGFAGIAAARDLRDAGMRPVVLEARDRIGGRTWYREIPGTGVMAEYGGMFFSRETQPTLAAEIARYGIGVNPAITEPDLLAWVHGDRRVEGPAAFDRVRDGLAASKLPDALAGTRAALAARDRSLADHDVPVSEWVDRIGADPEAADYLRAFLAAMGGAPLDRCSMLPLLWDMVELDYDPVDAYVDMGELFADGTKSLIDAMAAGLDLRFGAVVTAVTRDDDGVRVDLADGSSLAAAAAVVALPLNCWGDVRFTPDLAAPKRRVADERHVGEMSKILAVVANAPDTFLGTGWDTPANAAFVTKAAGDGRRLFMAFSVQNRVDLDDGDAVAAAVRAHLPEAEVVATAGHDWVTDPYARGTWLSIPPGWFSDGTFDRLCEPEGRLVFAGSDIAQEGAGWIEGAIWSGRAAAAHYVGLVGT
ncbi:MAG TPA: NAD(P)/FAD-dependent oxidoreductase [Actinomycetota bacterium]